MNELKILKKYYDGAIIKNDSAKDIDYLEARGFLRTKVVNDSGKVAVYAYTTQFGKKLMKHNLIR